MFLYKEELKTVSTDEIINKIVDHDDNLVTDIIDESIDVMSTYLHEYFNTEAIFSTEGNSRSRVILKHLKNIVKYEIYARRSKVMNEVTQNNYDETMNWLEKVAKGEIKPALPVRLIDTNDDNIPDTEQTFFKLGSRKNYINHH